MAYFEPKFDYEKFIKDQKDTQKVIDATMKFNREFHGKIPERHHRPRANGSILVFILCFVIVLIVSKLCRKCRSRPVITPLHESLLRNYYFDFFIFQTD